MRFKLILTIMLAFSLFGCASMDKNSTVWIEFEKSIPPIITLDQNLQKAGYVSRRIGENQLQIEYGNATFTMEPKIRDGGLSRIIVSQIYKVKPESRHNPELFVTLSKLNSQLSCAKYIMLPGNNAAEIQSSVTFIDQKLQLRELEQFLAWLQTRIREASTLVPESTLNMFEVHPNAN